MVFQIKAIQNYKLAGWLYIDKSDGNDDNKGYLVANRRVAWKTKNRETAYYMLNLCKVKDPTYIWELATY